MQREQDKQDEQHKQDKQDQALEIALPGFSEFVAEVARDRPGEDFSDGKRYTAEIIARDYPKVYASVCKALFFYKLPVRTVRDLLRMNGATVAAIRNAVIARGQDDVRAAFFSHVRRHSQRDIILCQLTDLIEEKIADEKWQKNVDVTTLMSLLNGLESKKPASNGTDVENKKALHEADDVIDVLACEILNGLEREKKSAGKDEPR